MRWRRRPGADDPLDLLPVAEGTPRRLSTDLPPGRLVRPRSDPRGAPILWISDGPAPPDAWASLRAEHPRSGLWPVLLQGLHGSPERPWDVGELAPPSGGPRVSAAAVPEATAVLAEGHRDLEEDIASADEEDAAVFAPLPVRWPGLAAAPPSRQDPDTHAEEEVDALASIFPELRLGLVAAARGADVPAVLGWQGAVNAHDDPARLSAVLRSWEDRFGARVIAVGFDLLWVAVAAPPIDRAQALAVAGEHVVFCADAVLQEGPGTVAQYAEVLVDLGQWRFWWD